MTQSAIAHNLKYRFDLEISGSFTFTWGQEHPAIRVIRKLRFDPKIEQAYHAFSELGSSLGLVVWVDYAKQLTEFSREYAGVLFKLTMTPEGIPYPTSKHYFFEGKQYFEREHNTSEFLSFDKSRLKELR